MTHLCLRFAIADEPVIAPTDLLTIRASQAAVLIECTECGWRSQPFKFKARTVHLAARTHFLGLSKGGKIMTWRCKRPA